jgi:sugar-specific transcriptional regulator TrmB
MGNMMGKGKPLKEVLRENKREINRAVRELDREKNGLEREEKRITMEIKKAAKENQMQAVRIMAKDLVRTRQHITKFIEMRRYVLCRIRNHGGAIESPFKMSVSQFLSFCCFSIFKATYRVAH